jgi:hypothetical protein
MEQIHGGSIMAVLLNNGFTPEWTKRTLANLLGQGRDRVAVTRPFVPAPAAFANPRPQPARAERPLPPIVVAKSPPIMVPSALPVAPTPVITERVVKTDLVEVPTATRVKAIDVQRRQQLLVSNLNLQHPKGCHVMAFALLPVDLFQGELGKFLMMACAFHAHGAANTMLLPALMEGSEYFGLPKHPLVAEKGALNDAVAKIKGLRQRVVVEHQRAASAMQSGDLSRMFDRTQRQAEYRQELSSITRSLAIALFGQQAWETHETRFRTTLDQM